MTRSAFDTPWLILRSAQKNHLLLHRRAPRKRVFFAAGSLRRCPLGAFSWIAGIVPRNLGIDQQNLGIDPQNLGMDPQNLGMVLQNAGINILQ